MKEIRVSDDRLIRREVYNASEIEVTFEVQSKWEKYIADSGIAVGPKFIVVAPKRFALLTHGFYIVHSKDGSNNISLVWNFGDQIGKGNTKPSNPFVESH